MFERRNETKSIFNDAIKLHFTSSVSWRKGTRMSMRACEYCCMCVCIRARDGSTYRTKCTKVKIDHKSTVSKMKHWLDVDIITYIGFNFLTTNVRERIEIGIL